MHKEDIKRLEAFETWQWRKIMKWTEHKTNEEVLEMYMQETRMLIKTLRDRQKNWVGHILRSNSLLRTVWEGRMEGKKVVGRPRTKVLDSIIQETDGGTYEVLKNWR